MSKELENLDLALDLMERVIQPTIFKGLKSDVQAIDFKLNRLAKVEELLGLYRSITNVFDKDHCDFWEEDCKKKVNQIKQLEEELK